MLQGDGVGRRKRERPPEEVPSEQVAMKAGSNLVGRAHAQEGGANALGHQGDQWTGIPSEERSRAAGKKGTIWILLPWQGLAFLKGDRTLSQSGYGQVNKHTVPRARMSEAKVQLYPPTGYDPGQIT